MPEPADKPTLSGRFTTTHWSVVLQAGDSASPQATQTLQSLCQAYWYPLYAHVRRSGWLEEDAKDLTQQFFARLLERNYIQMADPTRGRFRSFLLTALKNFLANEWEKLRTKKRGEMKVLSWDGLDPEVRYSLEPVDTKSPELLYERRWAATLLEDVLAQLKKEYEAAGRLTEFDILKQHIWGMDNRASYAETAARLGVEPNSVAVAIHRLRKRFRDQLRAAVSRTVSTKEEVDAELQHLLKIMSS